MQRLLKVRLGESLLQVLLAMGEVVQRLEGQQLVDLVDLVVVLLDLLVPGQVLVVRRLDLLGGVRRVCLLLRKFKLVCWNFGNREMLRWLR